FSIGSNITFLNSTSEPSACKAICPLEAVQLVPSFTKSPFSHTLMELPTHSMIMVFHSPSGFSELSVRLTMRRPLPSVIPQLSFGPRRFSISGTVMSSTMHQKSPASPCCIWHSIDLGNILYKALGVEACTSTPQLPGLFAKR